MPFSTLINVYDPDRCDHADDHLRDDHAGDRHGRFLILPPFLLQH